MSRELYKELGRWRIPVTELNPVTNDRVFLERAAPVIKEYQEKSLTSKSINNAWKGFYGALGDMNGFKYHVPRCPSLTPEEIEKGKMVLLIPPEIFTPEGLEGLCKVFPLRMSWTTDPKELPKGLLKISNSLKGGGCVVTETQSSAPYTTLGEYELRGKLVKQLSVISSEFSKKQLEELIRRVEKLPYATPLHSEYELRGKLVKQLSVISSEFSKKQLEELIRRVEKLPYATPHGGYNKGQLEEKIESNGGFGIRISTYMIASKFKQLITGSPFDLDTFSRVGEDLAITSTPKGYFRVSKCPSSSQFSNLGVRSESIISEKKYLWERHPNPGYPSVGRKVA